MIDNVRKTVHDFIQKENRGWITPERFNRYAYLAQMEIFESYFYEYNRWLNYQNKRLTNSGYSDIPKHIKEKIDRFQKEAPMTFVVDSFEPPVDNYRLLDVFYNNECIDEVTQKRARMLNKSNLTAPSLDCPIHVRSENNVKVYPNTIQTSVVASYIRVPARPKWTYIPTGNNPMFNPSAPDYQDFEIHPSDEHKLVHRILAYSGITIREAEVVQFAETQQNKKVVNENNPE